MSSPPLCYTREQLLNLRTSAPLSIPRVTKRKLWFLHLLRTRSHAACPMPTGIQPAFGNLTNTHNCAFPPIAPPIPQPANRPDRHSKPHHQSLTLGLLNVRSLTSKVDDVTALLRDRSIHVLFLVETWHDSDSVSLQLLRAAGLTVLDRPRPRKRADSLHTNHGGIAVLSFLSTVKIARLTTLTPVTFESLCVRLSCKSASAVIICIYRTGPVTSQFFTELSNILETYIISNEPLFIAGDLNIHVEKPDDPHSKTLLSLFQAYGLECRVTGPTHNHGGTLDIIASRCDLPSPEVVVDDPGLSDHCLVTWTTSLPRPLPVYRTIISRPWTSLNNQNLRTILSSSSLNFRPSSPPTSDIDYLAELYDYEITSALDSEIPMRSVRCRSRASDPWFDDDCKKVKRHARRLERRVKRLIISDPASAQLASAELKAVRLSYKKLTIQKRETFWKAKTECEKGNPRLMWKSINSIMGRLHANPGVNISADLFHQHIVEKVQCIHDRTLNHTPPNFSQAPSDCSFSVFQLLTVHDVILAIASLPNKHNSRDCLPTDLLKCNIDILAPFITILFNMSLTCGTFPRLWKEAVINPVLKKGNLDSSEVSSYRPISKLCTLSKVLERIVTRQLLRHLSDHSLLPSLQSAYRSFHSTETALLKVSSDILLAMDNGDLSLIALLDLSSAFDSVHHDILLRRLEVSFGLHGQVLSWFASFITDRSYSVVCDTSTSSPVSSSHGVPQGSVLGPILFLLYTSDLPNIITSHGLSYHMYADDIQIYGSCHPSQIHVLSNKMSNCLSAVHDWLASNRLLLNASKTEIMWLTSKRRRNLVPQSPIIIGQQDSITPTNKIRNLGVILDPCLSMQHHISSTVSKCFGALRQLRSLRRFLPLPVLNTLMVSLVHSRLDFCSSLLYGLPDNSLCKLQSILNAGARILFNTSSRDHVTPLLRSLQWLPIRYRITYRLAVFAFKCIRGSAPSYMCSMLQSVSCNPTRCNLRSASNDDLLIPSSRLRTVGARAFPIAAARIWNNLPTSLKTTSSISSFKRHLKVELLRIAYLS